MIRDLAFTVIRPDGHRYSIYADGQIEGFGESCAVINFIPVLFRCIQNLTLQSHDLPTLPHITKGARIEPEKANGKTNR